MVQHNNYLERPDSRKAWNLTIPEIQITPKQAIETPQKDPHVTESVLFRKFSRRFVDPALEHEYTVHLAEKNIKIQKIAIGFAVLMMIVALFVDFIPPFAEYNWLFRIVDSISLGCISLAFVLIFFKRLRIHTQTIIVISLTYYAIAIMIDAIWFDNDPQAGFSSATILVMVLICRLKFWISLVSCSFITVTHLILSIIYSHDKYPPQAIIAYPFGIIATSSICLYCSYYMDTMMRRAFLNNNIMTLEEQKLIELRARVDSLLNNIFPPVLRQKIQDLKQEKEDGADEMGMICDEHNDVTVLMADIVGFTSLSSRVSPQQLVEMLNTVFTMFDEIVDDLGMEKIRTLGDAYLCVSNMTYKKHNHQDLAVNAARQMINTLPKLNEQFKLDPPLALRIGIASGPVISGVTGLSKWNYDIFGRTVMDAFNMEASSEPLCITITDHMFKSLKECANFFVPISPGRTDAYTCVVNGNTNDMMRAAIKPTVSNKSRKSRVSVSIAEDQNVARDLIANSEFYQAQQREAMQQTRRYSNDRLNIKDLTRSDSEFRNIINRAQNELFLFKQRKILRILRFADKDLERQYSDKIATNSQVYTFRLTLVSIIPFVLWTLSDVMSSRFPLKDMPNAIWITDAILIVMAAAFAMFCKSSLFLKPFAIPINALYVCAAGCILAAQQYIDPVTVYHAYHPYLITFICFQYIRMKQVLSVASGMVVVIVSLAIFVLSRFTGAITQGDNFTHLVLYGTIVFMAGATNYLLELGLRREFLSDLILKKSLEEQDAGSRRAKLLLYNIIPRQIAYKLNQNKTGNVVDFFPNATMGFATLLIGDLASHPMEMFMVLNDIFTIFDKLVLDQECEKIKTINTTYMVVSGLPKERSDHAQNALRLIVRMFDALDGYLCPYKNPRTGEPYQIRLRVGVACGPVVAGVIGKAKYSYDCWSDVTNTASRMESNGIEGYIQTTSTVFELAHEQFPDLRRRDEIMHIKGKGTMETFLLKCM